MRDLENAKKFWKWFTENNSKFLFVTEVNDSERESFLNDFLFHLHEYCDHLYFQIGGHPDDKKVELIISAEGMANYFPKVEELVDAAPQFENWEIIKFKQPQGSGFITQYHGRDFDPNKVIYIPLLNKDKPHAVGIHICYPDYEEKEKATFVGGTYLMLDTVLGEKSTTLDIEYMDVIKTPKNITEVDFRHVSDLKEYIDKIKNR